MDRGRLALDPRKVRYFVHRSTELVKQGQAMGALFRVCVINRNVVEKRIDRRAERGQGGHGGGECLLRDSRVHLRLRPPPPTGIPLSLIPLIAVCHTVGMGILDGQTR